MSAELQLPAPLIDRLYQDPPRLAAVPLVSIDRDGFPHVALLSYFELIYKNESLFFFLNSGSRSTCFLNECGQSALIFVEKDFAYYVKGVARCVGRYNSQSILRLLVTSVRHDVPSPEEGEVWLKSGILVGCSRQEARRRRRLREGIRQFLVESEKRGTHGLSQSG